MRFLQNLFSYWANLVLVETLANSRTFQRFAISTDKLMKELSKKGALCPSPRPPSFAPSRSVTDAPFLVLGALLPLALPGEVSAGDVSKTAKDFTKAFREEMTKAYRDEQMKRKF